MQWDFWTLSPESAHQVTWLMGDRGLPDFPSSTMYVQIMPMADADDYRFNPFDLTKVWPHGDYPLVPVGKLTLTRSPENFFAQIEQSAFEPSNLVPGIAASPDKMLLGRLFSYPDTHRYRVGPNYMQLPVNAPKPQVNSYSKEGPMRYRWNDPSIPVYAPNSHGGPSADTATYDDGAGWNAGGDMVRSPYVQHAEDDDWGQPGTMVREVLDGAARDRLVSGHLLNGVTEPVCSGPSITGPTSTPSSARRSSRRSAPSSPARFPAPGRAPPRLATRRPRSDRACRRAARSAGRAACGEPSGWRAARKRGGSDEHRDLRLEP
jgi:catalase